LEHFVIVHKIKSADQLKDKINGRKESEKKKNEFSKYVDELSEKIERGEISTKDYRELISKWWKEH